MLDKMLYKHKHLSVQNRISSSKEDINIKLIFFLMKCKKAKYIEMGNSILEARAVDLETCTFQ